MTIDELKVEALRLDARERAQLAADLLESLEDLSEAEIEEMWAEEAVRRDEALDSGAARSLPADQVFADARARLRSE